ncbi:hypothetical protein CLU79DRAFT_738158 [Phycomyces nitens]|nr:hypothetical protein CLU79DRAFT_738158 [Phycomyces nitens]
MDEASFNINMGSLNARSKGTLAIVETSITRASTHIILGTITAQDIISVEIREPLSPKKLKADWKQKEEEAKMSCH